MTLETIYYVGQTIAVIAILISLIFVGIQMRDGNKLARAQMHQQIADGFTEVMSLSLQIDDKSVENLFLNANMADASVAEMQKFSALMLGLWKHLENVFYQHKQGFVADEYWRSTCNYMILLIGREGSRYWWDMRKSVFAEEFTRFVDALETTQDFVELGDEGSVSKGEGKPEGSDQ